MASLTRWTCVWVNSGSWWWTGRPGVLWFMGSQWFGHDWITELNWTELKYNRMLGQRGMDTGFCWKACSYSLLVHFALIILAFFLFFAYTRQGHNLQVFVFVLSFLLYPKQLGRRLICWWSIRFGNWMSSNWHNKWQFPSLYYVLYSTWDKYGYNKTVTNLTEKNWSLLTLSSRKT